MCYSSCCLLLHSGISQQMFGLLQILFLRRFMEKQIQLQFQNSQPLLLSHNYWLAFAKVAAIVIGVFFLKNVQSNYFIVCVTFQVRQVFSYLCIKDVLVLVPDTVSSNKFFRENKQIYVYVSSIHLCILRCQVVKQLVLHFMEFLFSTTLTLDLLVLWFCIISF